MNYHVHHISYMFTIKHTSNDTQTYLVILKPLNKNDYCIVIVIVLFVLKLNRTIKQ